MATTTNTNSDPFFACLIFLNSGHPGNSKKKIKKLGLLFLSIFFFCHNLQLGHCLRSLALPRFLANSVRLGPHFWMVCWFIYFFCFCLVIAGCIGECHWSGSFTLRRLFTLRVVFTLRVFHTELDRPYWEITFFGLLKGGPYCWACSIILSRIARFDLSNNSCGCKVSSLLMISHAFSMLLVVQNCLGRPTLL